MNMSTNPQNIDTFEKRVDPDDTFFPGLPLRQAQSLDADVKRLAARGYGWEDIIVMLGWKEVGWWNPEFGTRIESYVLRKLRETPTPG